LIHNTKTDDMQVDKKILEETMRMLHLAMSKGEEQRMLTNLNAILGWIHQLKKVNTEGVSPLTTLSAEKNCLRKDIPAAPMDREGALANATQRNSSYFQVPSPLATKLG
jgi:aspartyl-tRNA(Asn)/glutamyl-tRNA(Gln) amidotransferase subunit C